jgi:hypothetical protein
MKISNTYIYSDFISGITNDRMCEIVFIVFLFYNVKFLILTTVALDTCQKVLLTFVKCWYNVFTAWERQSGSYCTAHEHAKKGINS